MTPPMAHFIAGLSHGGWPLLVPLIVLFYVGAVRAGTVHARARVAGDEACTHLAMGVRWGSGLLLGVTGLLLVAAFFHVGCAAEKSSQAQCLSNVKQLGLGLMTYAEDYDERLPAADRWADAARGALGRHTSREVFVCPGADPPAGYGMNAALSRVSVADVAVPADTAVIFEAQARLPGSSGGPRDVVRDRHSGGSVVGFVDGHAKWVRAELVDKLAWTRSSPRP